MRIRKDPNVFDGSKTKINGSDPDRKEFELKFEKISP